MKAPICNVCLKSDVLCSQCSEKLEDGKITELDIEVSRKLKELSNNHGSLRDSIIEGTYEAENVVVIVTGPKDGAKVVGRSGEIVKKVADEVGKPIRVVENNENDREVINGLLSPGEIKSINTVFKPEGQSKKIVVDEQFEDKINMDQSELEEAIKQITSTEYDLAFE